MPAVTRDFLTRQLELAEQLRLGRDAMLEPQDLPGRYGRVVKSVDQVLAALACEGVLAGGWAVWRHGYVGRVTQNLNVILPANRLDEFLRVAPVWGFEVVATTAGTWPKLRHKDTAIEVDLLPEGGRPGTPARPAPTTIPSPLKMGAVPGLLQYISLPFLVELKLAAGRARDESDVVELLRANPDQVEGIRLHLDAIHPQYVLALDKMLERARDQRDA